MKLLYFHSASISSQMANLNQVVQMCNAFAANGAEVHLSLSGDNLLSEEVKQKLKEIYGEINFSISLRRTIISQMADNYLFTGSIRRAIKQIKPNLIFCRNHLYLKPCINSGIPTMFESHDANLHLRLTWLDKYWKKYIRKTANASHHFSLITISVALKHFWIDVGVPEEKIIALHDGFSPQLFEPPVSKKEARQALKLDPDKTIVTYTGNLYPNREVDVILNLAADFPGLLFLVVGGPDKNKEHLQQMAEQKMLSNIIFTGRVPHKNIPLYLFASDILLGLWSSKVRTINYCSPLKVFEYMASGRTIVAHGFPTIKEVLRHNENALLASPHNPVDLKEKLAIAVKLYTENHLGYAAKAEALSFYTWKCRAMQILDFQKAQN